MLPPRKSFHCLLQGVRLIRTAKKKRKFANKSENGRGSAECGNLRKFAKKSEKSEKSDENSSENYGRKPSFSCYSEVYNFQLFTFFLPNLHEYLCFYFIAVIFLLPRTNNFQFQIFASTSAQRGLRKILIAGTS